LVIIIIRSDFGSIFFRFLHYFNVEVKETIRQMLNDDQNQK